MTTDPSEKRLRELPWREPPASLKERVFRPEPKNRSAIVRLIFSRQIEWGTAAALVACAGIIGYSLGRQHPSAVEASSLLRRTELRIIETGVNQDFFDLTEDAQDPWPGPIRLDVQQPTDPSG